MQEARPVCPWHGELAPGRGCRCFPVEIVKHGPPVWPQFRCHTTLYKIPSHRRGVGLEFGKLHRIFTGKRIRDG